MKRLYRSKSNQMISGVAAGVAEYFEVDVSIVRVLWTLSVFLHGIGLAAYFIAWIILPVDPMDEGAGKEVAGDPGTGEIGSETTAVGSGEAVSTEADAGAEGDAGAQVDAGTQADVGAQEDLGTQTAGESPDTGEAQASRSRDKTLALLLIGLGVFFLVREFVTWELSQFVLPALLIGAGIYLVVNKN